jgi:peroxiredoxin
MTVMPQVERALVDAVRRDQQSPKRRVRVKRAPLALIVIVCVGSGVAAAAATGIWPSIRSAIRHGALPRVPETTVPSLHARARTSLEQFHGQIVLVSFWAAWCKPCIQQAPALSTINRELHATRRGTVVLVSTDNTPGQAAAMLRHERLAVPVISANTTDPDGRAFFRAFLGAETSALPVTFAIDRSGRVSGYTEGRANLSTLRSLLGRAERRQR